MNLVIIGCGAAGATAAQFARKNDREARIKIFEKGPYPEYSKCSLPLVISGELSSESVIEFSKEWFEKSNIELHLDTPVFSIDFDRSIVTTPDGEEKYDSLIIATGASPFSPVKPEGRTYFLRSLEDANAIRKEAEHSEKAVVVGAGLIGLEVAEALVKMGIDVTVVEFMSDLLLTMVDVDVARVMRESIGGNMKMLFGHRVTAIREGKKMEIMAVDSKGKEIDIKCDFVVISTGNKANMGIAGNLSRDGRAIDVNERCETSVENVYAAGDCTRYKDILGNDVPVGLGSVAVRQGMVAGTNAVGGHRTMPLLVNARTTKIFGVEIAAAGPLNLEQTLTGKFRGSTLPEYMEGDDIFIKVHADKKGRILGAQAVGPGAAQRIDKFSLAIQMGLTLKQFMEAETSYAPVVAPVIDASYIACEIASRRVK